MLKHDTKSTQKPTKIKLRADGDNSCSSLASLQTAFILFPGEERQSSITYTTKRRFQEYYLAQRTCLKQLHNTHLEQEVETALNFS